MICFKVLVVILYSKLVSSSDIEDSTKLYEKIARGRPVQGQGQYPYFVSIQYEWPFTGYQTSCGGALIERQIFLTAAHCFIPAQNNSDGASKARILPNYRNTPFAMPNDLTFKVKYYVIHQDFSFTGPVNIKNDIAVVLLDKPDPRPNATIRLPIRQTPRTQPVTLIGFGKMENGASPNVLHSANLSILTDQACVARNPLTGVYHPGFNF